MYGIVNKAIEEMIISSFGNNKWELIKKGSSTEEDFFISTETYDDQITLKLINAGCEETGIPNISFLHSFGECQVLKTGKVKYGRLSKACSDTIREFLLNLPQFHNKGMQIYPRLAPSEFKVSHVEDNRLDMPYFSKRQGLHHFMDDLFSGTDRLYQVSVTIELIQSREQGFDYKYLN